MATKIRVSYGFRSDWSEKTVCLQSEDDFAGRWIEVEETQPGLFEIVRERITSRFENYEADNTGLTLCSWDEEVVDLDAGTSAVSQRFGNSERVRWQEVDVTIEAIYAPALERVLAALQHVSWSAWCPAWEED